MDPKQFRKKLLKGWSVKGGRLFAKHWPALYGENVLHNILLHSDVRYSELGLCEHS